MGVHRTKEDKMKAQVRREQLTYSLPSKQTASSTHLVPKENTKPENVMSIDFSVIKADLLRSGISTLVIVFLIIAAYLWL